MQYTIDKEQFKILAAEIKQLKEDKKALIVAHFYQRPEIQDVADFVGDSLQLSQLAAKTDAEIIIFCGVHFMAESAAILSPEKLVILPEERAGCPMADMIDAESLKQRKAQLPGCQVVCYVNSSAAVKPKVISAVLLPMLFRLSNPCRREKYFLSLTKTWGVMWEKKPGAKCTIGPGIAIRMTALPKRIF